MATVPTRSYQNTMSGVTSSTMSFTGDSFEIDLSGEEAGETVTITVMFQNNACESMANISVTGMLCIYESSCVES